MSEVTPEQLVIELADHFQVSDGEYELMRREDAEQRAREILGFDF